jgi:hypothetical protein
MEFSLNRKLSFYITKNKYIKLINFYFLLFQ